MKNTKKKPPIIGHKLFFSDESSVEVGKQSRQVKIWRRVGERFNTECLAPTFKSGRQSVMIWGCFAGGIKGSLVFCDKVKEKKESIRILTLQS